MKNWIVDHTHSRVGFEVEHMMISKVRGQFDSYTVDVEAEELSDLTGAKLQFKFAADSINTRNRERDKHLKSADFFDSKNYPSIDFKSTNITEHGEVYHVIGDLKIVGITKEITFVVAYGGKGMNPEGVEVYAFEAAATINREDFDLTWNRALESGGVLVGKEVEIIVDLELYHSHHAPTNTNDLQVPSAGENMNLEHEISREEMYQIIVENLTDLMLITNSSGAVQYVNSSLKAVLHEHDFFEQLHPDEQNIVRNEIVSYSRSTLRKVSNSEFRLRHAEGYYMEVEADIISVSAPSPNEHELVLIVMRDISERKEVEKTIYQLAFHDHLTNLPNRRSFMNQLRSEVMDRKFNRSKLSVLFIDLDHFKQINDQWGHDAGDTVLKEAANKIRSAIRPMDVAARFGGDEFIVMLKDVRDEDDVIRVVEKILELFQNPIKQSDQDYPVTCSIGVAYYPDHGQTAEDLIQNADTALYYVKNRDKNNFMIFNQSMENQSLERRILENALRQGIKEQQFYLEFQPKININSNELIGMETLVRWNHPQLGIISPGKFIPLAEESGLIIPLGEWILRESCRQVAEWQDQGYPPLSLSVNISVRQLDDLDFVDKLKTILEETGLDPRNLELEITENVLVNDKNTVSVLKKIRKLGVETSIDDFGTGYSSLSYIKELPINTLKIDQSFIKDIHTNRESKEIVKAIIQLANSIGLNVIAEGIEVKEHVEELSKEGCILGQGYYYSRPLKAGAFVNYMSNYSQRSEF